MNACTVNGIHGVSQGDAAIQVTIKCAPQVKLRSERYITRRLIQHCQLPCALSLSVGCIHVHSPTHTHTHTLPTTPTLHTVAPAASPLFPHAQTLFQWPVHAHTPPPVLTPLAALALPLPWDKRLQEERERWATDYGRRREKWGAILTHSSDRSSFHLHNETAADTLIRKHPELFLPRKAL